VSIKSIQPIRIGFALYDKSLLTAVTLAAEMFMSANMLRPRQHQRNHPIQIDIIAPKNTKVDTIGALTLATTIDYSQDHHFDYIFLPPMWGNPMSSVMKLPQISTWLKWQLARQATIVATGTGVCWLAHCGLLNGKVATTHWSFSERFAQLFPDVILRKEIPITRSETIYCAKSINTQTELVVFFIAKMFGKDVARTIERHYTQDVSKSTDEPYFEFGGEVQPDETVSIAQDYLSANMSKNVSITALARHCDVSASTIVRHFKAQVGETPHQYLTRIRLNQAKSLLLDRNLTIGEVAELVGFSDSHYFSEKFYRSFAVRPRQYREMAKTKLYRR
jgi:transcriptional regulator GlxA family with amidase domain